METGCRRQFQAGPGPHSHWRSLPDEPGSFLTSYTRVMIIRLINRFLQEERTKTSSHEV